MVETVLLAPCVYPLEGTFTPLYTPGTTVGVGTACSYYTQYVAYCSV